MKIVAEISCNHQGTLERALELVRAAKEAGADAIKLQTWEPGGMVLDPELVLEDGPWEGRNLQELYAEAHTPWEWHQPIFEAAKEHGIEAFSSVFDHASLAFLQRLGCPRYKIASFEIVDLALIHAVAATRKPIILSTGMASRLEIEEAVRVSKEAGSKDITVLKCTSAYPADGRQANLLTMRHLANHLGVQVGLSDHTPGIGVALVAIAMGARMVEKHFTLSRAAGGLDAAFSIEPHELAALAREIPNVYKCWGEIRFGPSPEEEPQLELRRSLYFAQPMTAGTYLPAEGVRAARPAGGIAPRFAKRILGMKLKRDVRRGEPITWDALEKAEIVASSK